MVHPNVPQSRPIRFRTIVDNVQGPKEPDEEIIQDRKSYDAWIRSCAGGAEGFEKDIDFDRETVIAVALGERNTGGYDAQILSVNEITGGFVGIQRQIVYTERIERGKLHTRVMTYPHHVIRMKKFTGLITFRQVPSPWGAGEEPGGVTTEALGEEQQPGQMPPGAVTTLAVGEEEPAPGPIFTTLAVGEEGPSPWGGGVTTLAIGEESTAGGGGGMTTMAVGEESSGGGGLTTLRVGEEATTMAVGEESGGSRGGGGNPFGGF